MNSNDTTTATTSGVSFSFVIPCEPDTRTDAEKLRDEIRSSNNRICRELSSIGSTLVFIMVGLAGILGALIAIGSKL